MRLRFSFLPSPAMAVALAALLAASAGLAVAATSSSPVIRACANKRSGALRLSSRCKRSERKVSWNQIGPQGLRGAAGARGFQGLRGFSGATGAAGAAGAAGAQGPQGPGATSFVSTLAEGAPKATLATLGNGVSVTGQCGGEVEVRLETAGPGTHLQISGTASSSAIPPVTPVDENEINSSKGVTSTTTADLDVIARDSTAGKFARIDVHGQHGSTCTFWGLLIPSG